MVDRALDTMAHGGLAVVPVGDAHRRFASVATSLANTSPAAGVMAALRHGCSTAIHLTGDSTGDGTGATQGDPEWFYLLGQRLGARYPGFNVVRTKWNDTNSNFDPPTVDQVGSDGETYVTFSGAAPGAQYQASAITGDLRVEFKIRLADYSNGIQAVCGQYKASGNKISWYCGFTNGGLPFLSWSTDGTSSMTTKAATTTAATADGAWGWFAIEHDVDNGASGNDVKFYTSSDGSAWTQLGNTVTTAGATSHYNSDAPYTIGSLDSSHGSPMSGDMAWIRIRNGLGVAGNSVVPPLPDLWDNTTSILGSDLVIHGSPTLLMVNGSQGAQTISYFDDTTRRPKLFAPKGQALVFLSVGHNDANPTTQSWITTYSTWVGHIQTLLPNVPICCVTQNPATSPRTVTDIQARSRRGVSLATWARSAAGVYVLDTYPAFTDTTLQVNPADGVHPLGPGSQRWCDYVYAALFDL